MKARLALASVATAGVLAVICGGPASASTTAPTIYPSSSYGGTAVKCVQRALNWHYGINLAVDGYYGASTTYWVKQVQAENGLSQDGITGPWTGNKLMGSLDNAGLHSACYGSIPTTY
jgi:peptidoglycan hydrolase-like protein with peptidoglycan-binding domain